MTGADTNAGPDTNAGDASRDRARRLERVVDGVQWLVGVAAGAAVVMLFALGGAQEAEEAEAGLDEAVTAALLAEGQEIYTASCATCHGIQGQGGVGPSLVGVASTYPDPVEQAAVVSLGRGTMPAFSGELSVTEIDAVVAFTRAAFG